MRLLIHLGIMNILLLYWNSCFEALRTKHVFIELNCKRDWNTERLWKSFSVNDFSHGGNAEIKKVKCSKSGEIAQMILVLSRQVKVKRESRTIARKT